MVEMNSNVIFLIALRENSPTKRKEKYVRVLFYFNGQTSHIRFHERIEKKYDQNEKKSEHYNI